MVRRILAQDGSGQNASPEVSGPEVSGQVPLFLEFNIAPLGYSAFLPRHESANEDERLDYSRVSRL